MERLKFGPKTDDLEIFVSHVKQIALQLNQNEIAVLTLIKALMLADIYGTLHTVQKLDVAIALVKDINAKRPEPRTATGTTQFYMYNALKIKPKNLKVPILELPSLKPFFSIMQWTYFAKLCPS